MFYYSNRSSSKPEVAMVTPLYDFDPISCQGMFLAFFDHACARVNSVAGKHCMIDRPVGTEFILGELKRGASEASKKQGSGGLAPGQFFMTSPFRSLESVHFWKMCHLRRKQRITTNGNLSIKILKF